MDNSIEYNVNANRKDRIKLYVVFASFENFTTQG